MTNAPLSRSGRLHVASNRFPLKHAWDALSIGRMLARGDLDWAGKRRCLKFYFDAGGIRNLYPTLTRSGSHWSLLGMALAADLAGGGDGDYDYGNEYWFPHGGAIYTKLDWREPAGDWDAALDTAIGSIADTKRLKAAARPGQRPLFDPVVMHSHHPYCRLRSARLKDMRIAVLVRNIYDSMESKYFKHVALVRRGVMPHEISAGGPPKEPPSEANDYLFPWDKLLADAIEFFNSWGDAATWHPSLRVYHYDDLLADPVSAHKEITDFWGMNLPRDCLAEAFRRVSKPEMLKKIPPESAELNPRLALRRKTETLPAARVGYIRRWLERRLVHDFGYGVDWRKEPPAPHRVPAMQAAGR